MNILNKITPTLKSGDEQLYYENNKLPFQLKQFWSWSGSDLLSNATRGKFAEFIVATATGADIKTPRDEWGDYDLITPDNIKIEVKSSAYIQSWHQSKFSPINFSIKASRSWDSETGIQSDNQKRHADIYVMCLLHHREQETINPLDMSQWSFYVISTKELNKYDRSKHSITLKSLEKLTKLVDYSDLYNEILIKFKNMPDK